MPKVKMPDGVIVDMPDNPPPELTARLQKFLSGQQPQQFSAMNPPSIEDTTGQAQAPPSMPVQAPQSTASKVLGFAKDVAVESIPGVPTYREGKKPLEGNQFQQNIQVLDRAFRTVPAEIMNVLTAAPLLKAGLRKLPGAAPILQEEGIAAARKIPEEAIKGPPSQPLWNRVKAAGSNTIQSDKLADAIDDAVRELSLPANPDTAAIGELTNIKNRILSNGGQLSIEMLDADRRALAKMNLGGQEQRLYSVVHEVLDDAAKAPGTTGEAATVLKGAINASKKEFARDELAKLIERKIHTRTADKIQSINTAAIQDTLRKTEKGKKIIERLGAGEIAQIEGELRRINPPPLPPPGGASYGSGKFWQKQGILGGISSLIGLATGDPKAAAGVMAAGNVVMGAEYYLSRLLVTKPGRDFLRELSKAQLTPALAGPLFNTMKKLAGDENQEEIK